MKKVTCIRKDFHYKNGIREDIKVGDIFYIEEKQTIYDVYNIHGEYINVFAKNTFKVISNITDTNLLKAINRNKQIDEILNENL